VEVRLRTPDACPLACLSSAPSLRPRVFSALPARLPSLAQHQTSLQGHTCKARPKSTSKLPTAVISPHTDRRLHEISLLSHPPPPLPLPTAHTAATAPPFTAAARKCLPHPSTPSKSPGLAPPTNAHAPGYSSCACRPCLCSIAAACLIRFTLQSQTPATAPKSDSPGRAMPPHSRRQPRLVRSASMQGQPRDLPLPRTTRIGRCRPLCSLRMPGRSASAC